MDPDTLLLDAGDAEARIRKRTRALLPVRLYGQPCGTMPLAAIARRRGLMIVQDACQAHGAVLGFSHPAAYSFYPTKNLPCLGDGGAVLTDSRRIADGVRRLRDGGRRNDQVARMPAISSRLDEMQACYLRAFLPKLPEWNAERVRLASLYDLALRGCDGMRRIARGAGSVCHLYVIRAAKHERLRKHLAARGIITAVHYPVPLHLQPAFRDCGARRGDLSRRGASRAAKFFRCPYGRVWRMQRWRKLPRVCAASTRSGVGHSNCANLLRSCPSSNRPG